MEDLALIDRATRALLEGAEKEFPGRLPEKYVALTLEEV